MPAKANLRTAAPTSSEELVGRLHAAGTKAVSEILNRFSEFERAELAAHCYGRAHLYDVGLAIAATCGREVLIHAVGGLGEELYRLSRAHRVEAPTPTHGRGGKITLASSIGRYFAPLEDDEPDALTSGAGA
jgi:hypothetical protein